MERKINLLVFLVIFSQIDQSWSAVFWNFGNIDPEEDYTRPRSASVYRGLLLSYSPAQKDTICNDVFHAQLYTEKHGTALYVPAAAQHGNTKPQISDGETTEGESKYPVAVKKIVTHSKPNEDKEDLLFTCFGKDFNYRQPNDNGEYILSTAFRPSWMYFFHYTGEGTQKRLKIMNFVGLSAEHVPLDETKLEDEYVTIRKTLRTLESESPKYMKLIESKDNLMTLSRSQKLMLCASILSTPIYRDDRLEYSQDWIDQHLGKLEYYEKLTFADPAHAKDEFHAPCVYCKGFIDGDDAVFGESTKLYFTESFDNKDSLIVLKEDSAQNVFLSKYFRKVGVLMNVHEPIAEGTLHQNYVSFSNEF